MSTVTDSSIVNTELTKEKIEKMLKKIHRQSTIFADKRYLDPLFLTSKIIGREKQAEQLLKYIDSMDHGLVVPVISVYGRSGSGKSTVVRFICENLRKSVSHSFINLRRAKTVFGCANLILAELGLPNLKNVHGLNGAIEQIEKRIIAILEEQGKKFFVLILDEYDVIFSDLRGNPSDFMYKLLTLEENLRECGFWLCIITISNNALADNELDDRVKSRMGSSEIFFEPYNHAGVLSILQDRAKLAFSKKIDDEVLRYCADVSSEDHGDARRALDLLRLAGESCSLGKITKVDIDNALQQLQKDRITTILTNATYHLRVAIASICSLHVLTEKQWHATSTIYKKYSITLEKDKKPLSYRRIVDLLVELKNSGLVDSHTLSRGRQGYGTEYRLRFSPDMIGPLISKEWWNSVTETKRNHESKMEELDRPPLFPRSRFARHHKQIQKMLGKLEDQTWKKRMGIE